MLTVGSIAFFLTLAFYQKCGKQCKERTAKKEKHATEYQLRKQAKKKVKEYKERQALNGLSEREVNAHLRTARQMMAERAAADKKKKKTPKRPSTASPVRFTDVQAHLPRSR